MKTPIRYYLKAFDQFLGRKAGKVKYERAGGHTILEFEGITYKISSYEDCIEEFTFCFEKNLYDEISMQIPAQLWQLLIEDAVDISSGEMIVGIYKQWRRYWARQSEERDSKEWLTERKQGSFNDLQVLIQAYKEEPENLIKFAYEIDDMVLIPCIAMLVYSTYTDLDTFVEDCAITLFRECGEFVTFGDTHAEIILPEEENEINHFLITNPIYELSEFLEVHVK